VPLHGGGEGAVEGASLGGGVRRRAPRVSEKRLCNAPFPRADETAPRIGASGRPLETAPTDGPSLGDAHLLQAPQKRPFCEPLKPAPRNGLSFRKRPRKRSFGNGPEETAPRRRQPETVRRDGPLDKRPSRLARSLREVPTRRSRREGRSPKEPQEEGLGSWPLARGRRHRVLV